MNNMNKILAAITASMFISGAALALEGFSVGVIGSLATFDTKGSEIEGAQAGLGTIDNETTSTSISKDVDYGSVFAEYTHVWDKFGLTVGVEMIPGDASLGAKSRTDTQSDTNEASDDSGTYTAKAEISDHHTIYIEPTLMIEENYGIYIKGGISEVTVTSLESISNGTDDSAYGNEDVYGVLTAIGVKGVHENGLGFKLEFSKTA